MSLAVAGSGCLRVGGEKRKINRAPVVCDGSPGLIKMGIYSPHFVPWKSILEGNLSCLTYRRSIEEAISCLSNGDRKHG